MVKRCSNIALALFLLGNVFLGRVFAQEFPDPENYEWVEVVSGLDSPIYFTQAPDERWFVLEQPGYILLVEDGEVGFDAFLDVSDKVPEKVALGGYSEQGLLGLAFHPDFAQNGIFFVNYTDKTDANVIVRYTLENPEAESVDADSGVVILTISQPCEDHNGGAMEFGPDGYLYISVGDGCNPDDVYGTGQNVNTLLGKLLRIDVNDTETYTVPESNPFVGLADHAEEIWAYGLRNPWRFSFDLQTDDLYIADVGQWAWEEVNFAPAASVGGENYGWNAYEGSNRHWEDTPTTDDMVMPVMEYPHNFGCSITGGYVYRGEELPELDGQYFYGDYCVGRIWTGFQDEAGEWHTQPFMEATGFVISSFGQDLAGEIYLVDYKGIVFKLVAR